MDPAWVSIVIGLFGSLIGAAISGAICFAALKAWMARREEREQSMGMHIGRLPNTADRHDGLLGEHAVRIGVLEHAVDVRPPPRDYPVR
jgi:hypothetical protein